MKKFLTGNMAIIIYIIIAFFLTMGLIALILGGSLSKYINKSVYPHNLTIDAFYFVSDELSLDGNDNIINYYDFEPITVTLKNGYNGEYTKKNINYNISCSVPNGYTCKVDNVSSSKDDLLVASNNIVAKTHTITVTKTTGNLESVEINVTATSTSPFAKTITGKFIGNVANTHNQATKVLTYSYINLCKYKITNNNPVASNIRVSFNNYNYIASFESEFGQAMVSNTPDGSGRCTSITSLVPAYTSYELVLYLDPYHNNECSVDDITLTIT